MGILKGHIDVLPISCTKNVVYKILCNDCDASYVEQTGRQFKKKLLNIEIISTEIPLLIP